MMNYKLILGIILGGLLVFAYLKYAKPCGCSEAQTEGGQ
jgi:hypothetical protein